jgi:hypothetical protein
MSGEDSDLDTGSIDTFHPDLANAQNTFVVTNVTSGSYQIYDGTTLSQGTTTQGVTWTSGYSLLTGGYVVNINPGDGSYTITVSRNAQGLVFSSNGYDHEAGPAIPADAEVSVVVHSTYPGVENEIVEGTGSNWTWSTVNVR